MRRTHTHTVYLFIQPSKERSWLRPSRDAQVSKFWRSHHACVFIFRISQHTIRNIKSLRAEEVLESYSQVKQQQLGIWYSLFSYSAMTQQKEKQPLTHSLSRQQLHEWERWTLVIVAWVLYLSCALEKCVKKSELTFVVEVTAARIFSLQTPVCFRGPLKMVRKVNKYILSLCECACGLNMIFFAWGVGAFCLWFSWKRPIVSVKWQHTTLKRFVWKIVLKKMLIRSCKGLGSFVKMLGYSS